MRLKKKIKLSKQEKAVLKSVCKATHLEDIVLTTRKEIMLMQEV